jgi:ubiquinone/menaquinone biosynthesis C-methylase UbiE
MPSTQDRVTKHFDSAVIEFDSIYSGAGKSGFGRLLDKLFRKDIQERYRRTIDAVLELGSPTVLDVGCGSGRILVPLAASGARVTGLDPAPHMIDVAKKRCDENGDGANCQFVVNDLRSWETNQRFDAVIGIGLYDYLEDPITELRRMMELAKRKIVITFPRRWTWRAPIRKLRLGLRGCPVFFYSRSEIETLVREAGGEIESCRVVGKLYFVIATPTSTPS